MSKSKQLLVLNMLLFVALLSQAVLIFGHDLFPRDVFIKTHIWVGRGLVVIGVVHLIYNWGWIKSHLFGIPKGHD